MATLPNETSVLYKHNGRISISKIMEFFLNQGKKKLPLLAAKKTAYSPVNRTLSVFEKHP